VKETKHMAESQTLFRYLQSQAAQNIFENYGFSVLIAR